MRDPHDDLGGALTPPPLPLLASRIKYLDCATRHQRQQMAGASHRHRHRQIHDASKYRSTIMRANLIDQRDAFPLSISGEDLFRYAFLLFRN